MVLLYFTWGHHFTFTMGLKCFTLVWTSAYHNYTVRVHLTSPKTLGGLFYDFTDEIVEMSLYCYCWFTVHMFDLVALKSSHDTSKQRTTTKINFALPIWRKHGLNCWSWHVSKDLWNAFGASLLHQLIYVWDLNKGTLGKGEKGEDNQILEKGQNKNLIYTIFNSFFNWVDKYIMRQRLTKQTLMKTI